MDAVDEPDLSPSLINFFVIFARLGHSGNSTRICQNLAMDKFDVLELVGQGSFGRVFRGRCKESGRIVSLTDIKLNFLTLNSSNEAVSLPDGVTGPGC